METGIYHNIPFDEYTAWDCANNSTLVKIHKQSCAHAKNATYEETPSLLEGRLLHSMVLEPNTVSDLYTIAPDVNKRTKAGKEEWAEFCEANKGKSVITESQWDVCNAMRDSLLSHHAAYEMLKGKDKEVSIVWEDSSGQLCKARLDNLKAEILVDLKTTQDASPDGFARTMYQYGYYMQSAFYLDGFNTLTGQIGEFVFVAIEKTPPYAVAVYTVGDDTIAAGREAYRSALQKYTSAEQLGVWPAYSPQIETIDMPAWALQKEGVI